MTENPDAPPARINAEGSDDGEGDNSDMKQHQFNWYLKRDRFYKIVTTRWGLFTIMALSIYLYEIIWTIAGVNNYCDISRFYNTPLAGVNKGKLSCVSEYAKVTTGLPKE